MNPRSIRRAAERKALKDARRTASLTRPLDRLEPDPPAAAISEARRAANAANAQLSTAPRTAQGKAKSSVNAEDEAASLSEPKIQQITGLTGRTVLLPSDDVAAYRQHVQDFAAEFQPVGPRESELVQSLADHSWRLARIASLEMAIYAFGHEQFAEQFADRGELQAGFTQMHTFLHYEKQLRNLQIQESRIRRNREKDTAELLRLQLERADEQPDKKPDPIPIQAMAVEPAPQEPKTAANAGTVGFDFAFPNEFTENAACSLTDQLSRSTELRA